MLELIVILERIRGLKDKKRELSKELSDLDKRIRFLEKQQEDIVTDLLFRKHHVELILSIVSFFGLWVLINPYGPGDGMLQGMLGHS